MKVALVLCPFMDTSIPNLGIASIYAFLKKDFKINSFDFNMDFYKNTTKLKFNFFKYISFLYYAIQNKIIYKLSELNQKFIKKWCKELLKINPDIICFSCQQSNFLFSLKMAEKIKSYNKKIITIFGGPICSSDAHRKDIIKKEFIDFVLVGADELTLKKFLNNLKKNKKIKKCEASPKAKGEVYYAGTDSLIKNFDSLPMPDFSIFNLENYLKILPLSFSRGCPHNCSFCIEKVFLKSQFCYKSVKRIIKEVMYMKTRYSINHFRIADSLSNGNPSLLEEICDKIIEKKMNIFWGAHCRLDKHLTPSLLKKMREAGCLAVTYGIESGSSEVLNKMRKESNIKWIENVIKNTYDADIMPGSGWMIGFPTETSKDFLKTLKFIWRNKKYLLIFWGGLCVVMPGMDLYKNHKSYGIKNPKRKFRWSTENLSFTKRMIRLFIFLGYKKIINYYHKLSDLNNKIYSPTNREKLF